MTPELIAVVLGTGLLALVPARRVAERPAAGWTVAAWWVALWLTLIAVIAAPPLRRLAIPLAVVLVVGPWLAIPAPLARLLGGCRRPAPPRNVTPPEAGGPAP